MTLRTLVITTSILAAATAQSASAQTSSPKSRTGKGSMATTGVPSKSTYMRKKTNRSYLPPPPSIPVRASRRAASSRQPVPGLVGTDTSGRIDKAGRSVGFYANIRGKTPTGVRQSAEKAAPKAKVQENAQKDPFAITPKSGKK